MEVRKLSEQSFNKVQFEELKKSLKGIEESLDSNSAPKENHPRTKGWERRAKSFGFVR